MKYLILIIAIIISKTATLTAQDIEYKNDNYRYFNEIGISIGHVIFEEDATNINLEAASFFLPNIGFRTGATAYSDMVNTEWGIKIPALIAFRTSSNKFDYDSNSNENWDNSIKEDILYSLLYSLPMRFEFNIGPAFGYLSPKSETKRLSDNEKRDRDNYFINTKMLVTLDANLRASFVINRVNIGISGGASYLLTKNYKYFAKNYNSDESDGKIARWMGHVSFGGSYRF